MGRSILGGRIFHRLDGSCRRHFGTIPGFFLDAEPISFGCMHPFWGSVGGGPFEPLDGSLRVIADSL